MNIPADLKYTKNDEWICVEGGAGRPLSAAAAGITDYAQEALADIVYVELPHTGDSLSQGQSFGSIESVKAASEIYMPAGGTITAVNGSLSAAPEQVNKDPYGAGWMIRFTLANPAELDSLMDPAAYQAYCEERKH